MKKYALLVMMILQLCPIAAKFKYDITLRNLPVPQGKVQMRMFYSDTHETLATTDIKKGTARLRGEADQEVFVYFSYEESGKDKAVYPLLLDSKSTVLLIQEKGFDIDKSSETNKKLKTAFDQVEQAKGAELNKTLQNILTENGENIIPCFFLPQAINILSGEYLENYIHSYSFSHRAEVKQTQTILQASRSKNIGAKYIDLALNDMQGKEHHLSEYIGHGKYVLVDFWASWCAPCRAEIPNVKAAYDLYHEKGFDVLGISLDSQKSAWVNAVNAYNLQWPQLSDLKGWKSKAATAYQITGIPATILYGPDGKVVATNLRGRTLENKLKELIK